MINRLKPAETYTHTHTHTCNFLIAIFLSVFSIFSVYSVPSFATNVDSGEDATCDEDTLESPTGPVRLRAEYQPETINLNWYDENNNRITVPTNSNTCTYDTSISLPPNPTKTGYKFKGWKVIDIFSTLDASINLNHRYAKSGIDGLCFYDGSQLTCGADFEDLEPYGWKTVFSYGTVYGTSMCSSVSGTLGSTGTPINDNGIHCWCRATGYKPNGSDVVYNGNPGWVQSLLDTENVGNCNSLCTTRCTYSMGSFQNSEYFRLRLFGQVTD